MAFFQQHDYKVLHMKYLLWSLSFQCQINMIFYLWTVKAIQNSLLLHGQSPDGQVDLTLTFTEKNRLLLRCYVKDVDVNSSVVLLSCPTVTTGVCLENCITPCPIIRGSPNCSLNVFSPINSCKYELVSDRQVKLEYQIALNPLTVPGDWRCMFRGRRSNSVYLKYQSPHNTPEPLDNPNNTITSLTVQGVASNSVVKTNHTKRFDLFIKSPNLCAYDPMARSSFAPIRFQLASHALEKFAVVITYRDLIRVLSSTGRNQPEISFSQTTTTKLVTKIDKNIKQNFIF
ncbi:hypothetical protein PHET_04550 [Paragonimus heterotremus]|uniref:Uncharacterized protein n=1 Tax=Paragonimus heterotremus TaxID=100268 RepID=A0A8J4WQ48_9TREM|nr:hypothetical protein PHET_04550 [Paragonimus heterotremus]